MGAGFLGPHLASRVRYPFRHHIILSPNPISCNFRDSLLGQFNVLEPVWFGHEGIGGCFVRMLVHCK